MRHLKKGNGVRIVVIEAGETIAAPSGPRPPVSGAYALGWTIGETASSSPMLSHSGDLFTSTAQQLLLTDTGWGVAVMANTGLVHVPPVRPESSLEAAGFALEDVTEREPYPEVEHQTRRAYISARKLQSMALIRRGRQADLESVWTCLSDAFAPFKSAYTPAAYADTVPDFENLQRRLQTMVVFVAELSGRIVGTVSISTSHASEAHLRGMAVVPSAQGKGIAQQLLSAAIDHCRSAGCTRVTLDTTAPLRAAIRFYEKNGFRATGRIADFFGMKLFEYDISLDDGETRE